MTAVTWCPRLLPNPKPLPDCPDPHNGGALPLGFVVTTPLGVGLVSGDPVHFKGGLLFGNWSTGVTFPLFDRLSNPCCSPVHFCVVHPVAVQPGNCGHFADNALLHVRAYLNCAALRCTTKPFHVQCCFTSIETTDYWDRGAQDVHMTFTQLLSSEKLFKFYVALRPPKP